MQPLTRLAEAQCFVIDNFGDCCGVMNFSQVHILGPNPRHFIGAPRSLDRDIGNREIPVPLGKFPAGNDRAKDFHILAMAD